MISDLNPVGSALDGTAAAAAAGAAAAAAAGAATGLPAGWAGISPNQIYAELQQNTLAVQQLAGQLAAFREDLGALSPLESRVRGLETRLAGWLAPTGAAGGLVGLLTAAYQLVTHR